MGKEVGQRGKCVGRVTIKGRKTEVQPFYRRDSRKNQLCRDGATGTAVPVPCQQFSLSRKAGFYIEWKGVFITYFPSAWPHSHTHLSGRWVYLDPPPNHELLPSNLTGLHTHTTLMSCQPIH